MSNKNNFFLYFFLFCVVGFSPYSQAEDNYNVRLESCTVLLQANSCFKRSQNALQGVACVRRWEDPVLETVQNLIDNDLMIQEEYDREPSRYRQERKLCRERAIEESSSLIDKIGITYRCLKEVAINYTDFAIQRLDCSSIVRLK